jgi:GntR family transcriptional regulator
MILNLTDLSDEPLQRQISRQIRAMILAGDLDPGTALASIRSLARENHVSVITVQRAYEMLMHENLIHSRRGKGFFVSEVPDQKKKSLAVKRLKEKLKRPVNDALAEGLKAVDVNRIVDDILKERKNDQSV